MKTLLLALLAQVAVTELAPSPPRTVIVEGHVGVLRLDDDACSLPLAAFGAAVRCRPDHTLLVAVPIGTDIGPVGITDTAGRTVAIVDVGTTAWPQEHRPASTTRPAPAGRTEADRAAKDAAYAAHADPRWTGYRLQVPLRLPLTVPYRVTDPFGFHRFYGTATVPVVHNGTDIAAPATGGWGARPPEAGSIAPGVVVLAQELWDSGNTVIIYHGDGVYSAYCHLKTLRATAGDKIPAGSTLGIVGGTVGGGSVGVHLHLVLRINGVSVDALDGIATLNGSLR